MTTYPAEAYDRRARFTALEKTAQFRLHWFQWEMKDERQAGNAVWRVLGVHKRCRPKSCTLRTFRTTFPAERVHLAVFIHSHGQKKPNFTFLCEDKYG